MAMKVRSRERSWRLMRREAPLSMEEGCAGGLLRAALDGGSSAAAILTAGAYNVLLSLSIWVNTDGVGE